MPTTSGASSASRLLIIIQDDDASLKEKEDAFSREPSRLQEAQKTQGRASSSSCGDTTWMTSRKTSRLLMTSYGCGKTHLAVASLFEVRKRYEKDALFLVMPTFLQEFKSFFQDGRKVQKHLTRYQRAALLVIDDLGKGQKVNGLLTGWVKEMLFSLINYRYEHDLKNILTSRSSHRSWNMSLAWLR